MSRLALTAVVAGANEWIEVHHQACLALESKVTEAKSRQVMQPVKYCEFLAVRLGPRHQRMVKL